MKTNPTLFLIILSAAYMLGLLGCKSNSGGSNSIVPAINCNFPPSESNFGYSYSWVEDQFMQASYSNENIVCNFMSVDPIATNILLIDKYHTVKVISDNRATGQIAIFNKKILFTDSKNGYPSCLDIETLQSEVVERNNTFYCYEFSFSPVGSKFAYKARNEKDISNSYIFIRDSSLVKIDSINFFDLALEDWKKLTWLNEHTLLYVFQNNEMEFGIKQFSLKTRQVETIFQSTITNNKDIIRSMLYSEQMGGIYFCDGNSINKIDLRNPFLQKIKSSCDSLEYCTLSQYTPNLLLVDKVTRTKKSEMNIEEKHALFSLNPITLEEKLIMK